MFLYIYVLYESVLVENGDLYVCQVGKCLKIAASYPKGNPLQQYTKDLPTRVNKAATDYILHTSLRVNKFSHDRVSTIKSKYEIF